MRWTLTASALALGFALSGCDVTPLGTGAPKDLSCSSCHGSSDNPAPPQGVNGQTDTGDLAVGAHQSHLNDSTIRKAIACSDCHPVPDAIDSPGHADGTVDFAFSPLASTGGLLPHFDQTTATCSATWCHGSLLHGGRNTRPVWNNVGGGQASCGSCHGLPPPAPHPSDTQCHKCHAGTVKADGTLDVEGGLHIDGIVEATPYHPAGWANGDQHGAQAAHDLSTCKACHGDDLNGGSSNVSCNQCHSGWKTSCTFCHGGTDNSTGAPPRSVGGSDATTDEGVGAHTSHLTAKSAISSPWPARRATSFPPTLSLPGTSTARWPR